MGHVVPFPEDRHREVQLLLPWYATGRLDLQERVLVEAHLRQCAECRADLVSERDLRARLADLAEDGHGREACQSPLSRGRPRRSPRAISERWRALRRAAARPRTMRRIMALQAACIAALGIVILAGRTTPAYHALGDPPSTRAGNAIVIFRPDIRGTEMSALLRSSEARVIDGPTSTGAYVLALPPASRDGALATLRRTPAVIMAERVDRPARQ